MTYTPQTWVANTTVVSATRMNYIEAGITSAAAGSALTLLSTTALASTGTLDIASISQSYNDLIIVGMVRSSNSSAENVGFVLNNDATSNFSWQYHFGLNTAAQISASASAFSIERIPQVSGTSAAANYFHSFEATILNYTSTAFYKNLFGYYHGNAGTAASGVSGTFGGTWHSTAAINRVALVGTSGGQFITGSTVRIYGRL